MLTHKQRTDFQHFLSDMGGGGGGGLQGRDIGLKKEDVKVIYKLGLRMWSDNRPLFF